MNEHNFTRSQVMALKGCSRDTLRRWIDDEKFPPPDSAPTKQSATWKR